MMNYQKYFNYKALILCLVVVLIIMVAWSVRVRSSHLADPATQTPVPSFAQPYEVVHDFMAAVRRGELIVFDMVLSTDMIQPQRVDYSFELDASTCCVTIYSAMHRPVKSPQLEGLVIIGVSAVMNQDGEIVETRAHVESLEAPQE